MAKKIRRFGIFKIKPGFDIVYPMRRVCDLCGKKTRIGRNRSHAQNRSPREYRANVQKVTLDVGEGKVSGHFCAKCLKRLRLELRKESKEKTAPKKD